MHEARTCLPTGRLINTRSIPIGTAQPVCVTSPYVPGAGVQPRIYWPKVNRPAFTCLPVGGMIPEITTAVAEAMAVKVGEGRIEHPRHLSTAFTERPASTYGLLSGIARRRCLLRQGYGD